MTVEEALRVLKPYFTGFGEDLCNEAYKEGYQDAISDMSMKLIKVGIVDKSIIEQVAEQLKEVLKE